jgi:glutaredoxin
VTRVALYTAAGCHLCEQARAVIESVGAELAFELEEIDITGDEALEQEHREWLPVVEIDGVRSFVYFVPEDAFRKKLKRDD